MNKEQDRYLAHKHEKLVKRMKVKDLKGRWFAVRTTNEPSNEEKLASWLKKLAEFGVYEKDIIEETGKWCHEPSGSYLFKTIIPNHAEGELVFQSKTYYFKTGERKIYGNMPKAKEMTETGFFMIDFRGYRVEYTLKKGQI